jgi:hypothetical protein
MRIALVAVFLSLGLVTAHAQQVAPKSAAQKSIGHSVIPEKIGKPLRRGITSSDVKLQNAAPLRLEHRQRPVKSKSLPTR